MLAQGPVPSNVGRAHRDLSRPMTGSPPANSAMSFRTSGCLSSNTTGTGADTPSLLGLIRREHPDLPALHIGHAPLAGMPSNVPTLPESFTADQLLTMVESLIAEPEIATVESSG
jgi:hypothetical protein